MPLSPHAPGASKPIGRGAGCKVDSVSRLERLRPDPMQFRVPARVNGSRSSPKPSVRSVRAGVRGFDAVTLP